MTREEAKEILEEVRTMDDSMYQYNKAYLGALEMAIQALELEPKIARWVKTPKAVMGEGYMWYCNECEHQVYQDSSRPYPSENYCPNCGAIMYVPQEIEDKE